MGVKVREKVAGSGVWWLFVNHKGRRTSRRVGSLKAAEKAAEKIEAKLVLGEGVERAKRPAPTLVEFFERYRKTYLATATKAATRDIYRTAFDLHVLPELGARRIDEIQRSDVVDLIGKLVDKGLAKTTIRINVSAFSALLNQAVEEQLIPANPAARTGKFYRRARSGRKEIEPLSAQEAAKFLETVRERAPQHFALFLTALHTGMRSGEIAGLQWGDVDFGGKFATVRRNVWRGRAAGTKTDRIRRVDLSDAVCEALEAHRRRLRAEWLKKGRNEVPEWVFANQEGRPADMQNVKNRWFYRCLEKAGLRRIRFHDLRHTYATLLIQQGESLAYVRDQLGHSSIRMTVDTYTHWMPGSNRQAVNRLPCAGSKAAGE